MIEWLDEQIHKLCELQRETLVPTLLEIMEVEVGKAFQTLISDHPSLEAQFSKTGQFSLFIEELKQRIQPSVRSAYGDMYRIRKGTLLDAEREHIRKQIEKLSLNGQLSQEKYNRFIGFMDRNPSKK